MWFMVLNVKLMKNGEWRIDGDGDGYGDRYGEEGTWRDWLIER